MKKKPKDKRRRVDEAWLVKAFQTINYHFFDDKVPGSLKVRFMKDCGHWGEDGTFKRADAFFDRNADTIVVDDMLAYFPDMATIALAHEMCHAHLRFNKGYEGWPVDAGHGTMFQLEIGRLWNAGLYDGIL
jgi:hypothetical protein